MKKWIKKKLIHEENTIKVFTEILSVVKKAIAPNQFVVL